MNKFYSRKLTSLFTLALLTICFSLSAQVASYTFASSSGTYTPVTGGTTIGAPASNDDASFLALPIGFTFCFNGVTYTTFSANCNGFISMGNTVFSSYTSLSTGTSNNIIAAFNSDLQSDALIGDFQYKTIGTAPSRTLVVQWTNFDNFPASTSTDVYNFQILLQETTNTVEIVYGAFTVNTFSDFEQVGLRGSSNLDFNNRSVANTFQTWATSIAGTFNNSTCEINNLPLAPVTGQTFTYSQPAQTTAPNAFVISGATTTAMNLTWNDNSTTESSFSVARSTDNITFSTVAVIPSTTSATTGTPYTFNATNLFSNTLYYWRITADNANCSNPYVAAQQSTLSGTLCGTFTIGPTGAYVSITAAVAAVVTNSVNCPLIFELQAAYLSTVETFPIVIPFLGTGPNSSIICRPELGATNLVVTSNATQTINFNGTTYFSFDGRPGGVGTARHLTIANTSTIGNAALFINGAQNCGFNYCNIRGVNTSTASGVILFSTATASSGNSNNSITNCDIYDNVTQPANLIYSLNTTPLVFNTGNTISNNILHDCFLASGATSAIYVGVGNNAWTINNNSFYQSTTRTYTIGAIHYGINIVSSTSTTGGYTVNGNSIGGTAALCAGSAYTIAGISTNRFVGIAVTSSTGATSNIQGNTIKNFNLTTSSGATTTYGIWCGIYIYGTGLASFNVGTTTANVIGSNSANSQIVTNCTTTGGMTVGIYSGAYGIVNISNNQIGGIIANSSTNLISSSIFGINACCANTLTISNNVIGSTTLASSFINAASLGTTGGHTTGIFSSASLNTTTISSNTVMNLTNQYGGTSTTGQTRGIYISSGSNTVTGNTIGALTNLSPQIGINTAASVIGIGVSSTFYSAHSINLNTISGLGNGSVLNAVNLTGIYLAGPTTTNSVVFRNTISAIGSASAGTAVINGIVLASGIASTYNNFINLGLDAVGASLTNSHEYNGIIKSSTTNNKLYYNTIAIQGTGIGAGAANTYAFRRTLTGVDTLYNNILFNSRSNGVATGINYSFGINNSTTFISNKNIIYGNGTGYVLGLDNLTPYATIGAWTAASSQDINSFSVNPTFLSLTNLHINNATASALESRGVVINGITNDYDNQTRPGPIPSVNGGGILPDIGADEFDGIPLQIDMGVLSLWRPSATGCHGSADSVTLVIKNFSSVPINFAINPVDVNSSVTGPNAMSFPTVNLTSGILPGNSSMNVTVSTTYNMSALGTYVFNAVTVIALDVIPSNDALTPVSIVISGGITTVSLSPICLGSSTVLNLTGQTAGGTIQWESSPNASVWSPIPSATTNAYTIIPTALTYYRAQVCGLHSSIIDTVITINVSSPVAINGTRCGIGPVTIGATATDTIKWFANLTGGTPLYTGPTYTPTVSATTTFYAQNTFTSCGGLSTPSTPTCYPNYTYACTSNDFINNFSTTLGTTNISNLSSGCNGNVPSNTLFYPNQIVTCAPGASFNLAIQAGTTWSQGFRIWIDYNNDGDFADVGEAVWASATSNILVNTGTVTVPANIAPGPKRMRVMCRFGSVPLINDHCNPLLSFGEAEEYTLSVCTECASVRTPVIATVTPPPAINALVANASLCGNDTTLLSVVSSNSTYNYVWSPATFLNITLGDSVLFMPTTPGNYTYYVDATDPVSGCATRDTVSALMSSIPTVTASVNLTPICAGTSVNLTAAQPSATTQITNGNIVNSNYGYPAPYGQFYGGSRHQMLILASELITAGLSAGNLSGLTFQVTNTNLSAALTNFTISLAATSQTTMSTGFAAIPFTTVFTSPSYAPTTLTNTHLFSTPFYWNGTSNIIVQTCFANYTTPPFTTYSYNCSMRQTATSFVSTAYNYYDNTANICALGSTYTISQRPNIAFLSSFASWTYAWTPSLNITNPNQQNTSAAPQTSTNFIVTVTDTTSGCNSDDTVAVVVNPNPMPMLGADTTICSNTSLVLNASAGAYNYLWSNAATSQTIPVTTPGNYNVLVTDSITGCFASDSIVIAVNAAPTFSLGADMVVCSGNTATFTGPTGQYNYNWNTLATTQSLITGINGSYVLTVTDLQTACFSSDTVALIVNALPAVALGNDTTICSNASLVLNASAGAYNYLWSNAATSQTIPVSTSGNYNVLVTDSITGCFASDSIMIAVNAAPSFSLGADMLVCSGNTVTFTGPTGQYNYNWNTLATTQTITTGINGSYVLTVTDLQTACFSSDTVALTVNALPIVALGNDITICSGNLPTTLVGPTNANFSYLWSNSTTNDSLSVSSSGNYYLLVTDNTTTCFNSDSILVSVNASPTVYLGNDTMLCGVSLTLNAGNIGASYAWSTSATSQTINVSTTGPYSVLVTDVNGCSDADTMNVTINPIPTVTATASSSVVCVDDAVVTLTGTPTGGVWSGPGVTGSSLSPTAAGLGTHTAIYSYSDLNGCAGTAPVTVQVNACVNVMESVLANGFNVYPNPTNGTFTLTIKDADFLELSIQITSIDGKLIASDRTSNVSGDYTSRFDLATHANGIYFLKVSGNGQTFVQKIVKQD